MTTAQTPFHDLDAYNAVPRLAGLAMSPDGERLVTTVQALNRTRTKFVTSLWEVDPRGRTGARRLTRSEKGESSPAFTADGDLLFVSGRPDPDAEEKDGPGQLWRLPAGGGEAEPYLSRKGGVGAVHPAERAGTVLVSAGVMPGADTAAAADPEQLEKHDAALRTQRKDRSVAAILHSSYPVRYWDHDLGPGQQHLLAVTDGTPRRLRDLTPGIGTGLLNSDVQVSPDGSAAFVTQWVPLARGTFTEDLVRVDVATGERTTLLSDRADDGGRGRWAYSPGPVSPDGATVVVVVTEWSTPERAPRTTLALLPTGGGELQPLAESWDRWPTPLAWFPDGRALLVVADDDGRAPLFRIEVATGEVTPLTTDTAAYSAAAVHPDGSTVFAVRSGYAFPSEVVRIDVATGQVTPLPGPAERPVLPGRLTEIETTAEDGSRVRAFLALPDDASAEHPAPLALWIHGGPLNSWNAWTWRWCPWLYVAQGWAVLLPDPALSTGYGQEFVQRGWGRWGAEPFTDLMAITDAAQQRDDISSDTAIAMGGSFGGYMANWVAGHTDRFAAIVTHASLWALDQFGPTTDLASYWEIEMTSEMAMANSPHLSVGEIRTPVLVVHGDKDYRVPIGEGLRLWWELLSSSGLPAAADGSTVHRFLYYPDENHWVLTPEHAKVWYQVTLGFVAEHALGRPAELPPVLGLVASPDDAVAKQDAADGS